LRPAPGSPFFFKLKAPRHAIAGFGFFAHFSVLPDWLAWDTFTEANGVSSLAALRGRLQRVQLRGRVAADSQGRIGCCLIAETHFFSPDEWVRGPADWHVRTQTGARYDLTQGEGLRIGLECLARVAVDRSASAPAVLPSSDLSERFGAPALVLPRLGQGIFRVRVLDAYGRACAVSHEHSLPVLEAAHLKPYADGGEHRVTNGIALRSDIHRLLDRGYVTVDEQNRFVVSGRLREDFDNGSSYEDFKGRNLVLPNDPAARPDPDALAWHRETVFLG
jgi:putative restriction endonuclease